MTRRIALLATGGTIACTFDADGLAVKTLDAAALAATFPAPGGVEVVPVDFGLLSGWDMTPSAMLDLARRVDALLADDADGVVVTHGTDTLEETAALLSFAVRSDQPVVVTGAMRTMGDAGPDGPRNLLAATLTAADPGASGRGALVVLNDEVHRGVEVTKRHSANAATFGVPFGGPVGSVDGTRVTFRTPPAPRIAYDVSHAEAKVPLLVAAAGLEVDLLEAALRGADGLVVAGFGLGHVPGAWLGPLGEAVAGGVPVVMASRTHAGPTGAVYRGPGGGVSARDRGVLEAGHRTPYAARIELICALGAGVDPRTAFATPLP